MSLRFQASCGFGRLVDLAAGMKKCNRKIGFGSNTLPAACADMQAAALGLNVVGDWLQEPVRGGAVEHPQH